MLLVMLVMLAKLHSTLCLYFLTTPVRYKSTESSARLCKISVMVRRGEGGRSTRVSYREETDSDDEWVVEVDADDDQSDDSDCSRLVPGSPASC